MREFRPYGSVRGALRNERPYRDHLVDLRRLDKSSGILRHRHRQRLEMRLAAGDLGGIVVTQIIDEQAISGFDYE